jgi:hypothetical protein
MRACTASDSDRSASDRGALFVVAAVLGCAEVSAVEPDAVAGGDEDGVLLAELAITGPAFSSSAASAAANEVAWYTNYKAG